MKVIAQTTGYTVKDVKGYTKSIGDIGIVSEQLKNKEAAMIILPPLTVHDVFSKLKEIAKMSGHLVRFLNTIDK